MVIIRSCTICRRYKKPLSKAYCRMDGGVNSIICKQRGRFFDVKRASPCYEERLSFNGGKPLFLFNLLIATNEDMCFKEIPNMSCK